MTATTARHLHAVPDDADGYELPLIQRFEVWLRGAGRSDRYVRHCIYVLNHLARHADRPLEDITELDVSRFLGRVDIQSNSRASYFSVIACFFGWYATHGGRDVTARLPRPRTPKGVPRPVTDAQLRDLLATRMHHRTRVMILLAALAGLRVHEIAKVRGEDVDPVGRTLRVTGKGDKTAVLPLHPLLAKQAATMPATGWWFPGNSKRPGQQITWRAVSQIISQAMRRAGIPGGTAHQLRHWYGTTLVGDGADLRTAQALLRHENLNTTAIYVGVRDEKRTEAIDRLDPLGQTPA